MFYHKLLCFVTQIYAGLKRTLDLSFMFNQAPVMVLADEPFGFYWYFFQQGALYYS